MARKVTMGFEPETVTVRVRDILPLRQVTEAVRKSRKYRQIEASIRKAGIAHPPTVARHATMKGSYLLLDGHIRIEVLKALGIEEVVCLVSLDDEAFTYNRQVNRLATVQEHRMILKVIERGVSERAIAETLDVDIASIRAKRNLLRGICAEAVEMLKDKHCPINTIQALRRLKPTRQVEVVDLMIRIDNFAASYARALVAATPPEQLVDAGRPRVLKGVSPDELARIRKEVEKLREGIDRVEATYGPDHLNLVIAAGHVRSLLGNEAIDRHLSKHHPEMHREFAGICEAAALVSEAAE